jgi:hypothetical protein
VTVGATVQAGADTFEGASRVDVPVVNWDGIRAISAAAVCALLPLPPPSPPPPSPDGALKRPAGEPSQPGSEPKVPKTSNPVLDAWANAASRAPAAGGGATGNGVGSGSGLTHGDRGGNLT